MGRNKLMRAGSIVAVAAVVSTSAVSGTFAKYVSEGSGSDSARVAKWGVTVTASGTTFATAYDSDLATKATDVGGNTIAQSVESNVKVVAPGTKGKLAAVKIEGTPEVAVEVGFSAVPKEEGTGDKKIFSIGDNWKLEDGTFYCPLKITVGGTEISGLEKTSAADFEKAVSDAVIGLKRNYKAGTDLSTIDDTTPAITWEWAFEDTTVGAKQTDVKDTYLGDLAADTNTTNDPTIELNLKVTVTQID